LNVRDEIKELEKKKCLEELHILNFSLNSPLSGLSEDMKSMDGTCSTNGSNRKCSDNRSKVFEKKVLKL
jgi:hypothetical protein